MFTIIGGDGKEYGPVAANQIREWLAGGRANLDTKAKAVGSEEWRRLGDFAEFGPPAHNLPPPPPIPTAAPYYAAPPSSAPTSASPSYASPSTAPGAELAGRGERFLAQLLDSVIGLTVCLPGGIMIGIAAARAGLSSGSGLSNLATAAGFGAGLLVLATALLALFAVQLWMLVTRGQTIGKRVLGVRIVSFGDETNPGFVKVFLLRAVVPALLGAVPYLGIVFTLTDYCFIFRDDRRCLHDLIASTKVIKS